MGHFGDGADAGARIISGMGGAAMNQQLELTYALAAGFDCASRHGRFKHQGGGGAPAFLFDYVAREVTPSLFVAGHEQGDRSSRAPTHLFDSAHGERGDGYARLHIEYARP